VESDVKFYERCDSSDLSDVCNSDLTGAYSMMEYEWESELEDLLMCEYPELYDYFYG